MRVVLGRQPNNVAGHSRWAQVKHRKAGSDAKRGALFSKLGRLIAAAAREGGPDPAANAKLRQTVDQARSAGLPKENVERAIRRAQGGGATGTGLEARSYEAYGPGGSAFLIDALTDNPNRTTAELKAILGAGHGQLVAVGSVAWLFTRRVKAEFTCPAGDIETAELALIDAGAEDTAADGQRIRALVDPGRLAALLEAAARMGLYRTVTTPVVIPKDKTALSQNQRTRAAELAAALDAHPDVTAVWTNAEGVGISP